MQDPGLAHSVNSGCGVFEGPMNENPSHLDRHLWNPNMYS